MDPNVQEHWTHGAGSVPGPRRFSMSARLRTHHAVLVGLGCAVAAITACSSPEPTTAERASSAEPSSPKITQASSVRIETIDLKGVSTGFCAGTLLSSKLVLTAGHCIAGASKWKITSPAGQSDASIASTPWRNFGSDMSHPEHWDVGLILLDGSIKLDSYPELAATKAAEGTEVTRFHHSSATSNDASGTDGQLKLGDSGGFKLDYLMEPVKGEFLDVGGAVVDSDGKILGVVSGLGKQSDLLHVARVDMFSNWTKTAVSCSTALGTRSWGGGNGSTPPNKPGGGGWGGGAGGGGWGSSSGGYGGSGGMGGGGSPLLDGGSSVPGSSGGSSSGGSSGTSGSSGSSGDATGGGNGGGGTTSGGATPGGDNGGSCPGPSTCQGSDCGAGNSGNNGGTGSGGTAGDGEGCGGGNDNPSACPPGPDSASCVGPNCGGCAGGSCSDTNIDFGNCPSCGSGPVLR